MTGKDVAMRYWIGVASRDHVKAGEAGGFCQLNHGKSSPLRRMRPGDRIVYYSPRTEMRGGDTVQAFTAIGAIAEGEPYAGDMGGGFVAMRRDVTFFRSHDAPIKPLLDGLSLTSGRKSWGAAFRFGMVEITADDYALIARAMGADDPEFGSPDAA
jgi:EVE domain